MAGLISATGASAGLNQQEIDKRVDKLLNQMTLEEKVGQMAQVTIDLLCEGPDVYSNYEPLRIDKNILKKAIEHYKIGSVLNVPSGKALTREKWYEIISEIQNASMKELKIPMLYGIDAIHGNNYTAGCTLFPQQIAMAASFNRGLVRKGAEITAYETRASNTPWTFSPVLDLGLNPEWPRMWETFGEDPYLASQLGVEMVKGYEGDGKEGAIDVNHVASCLKHFLGYSAAVSGKDRTPAILSENVLREYHLPSFQKAIEAGARSIMVNSGLTNGLPLHADYNILTKLLKEELGFKGVVVTDWMDIVNICSRDHVAATQKEAVKLSVNAGIDMSMIPYNFDFCDYLIQLVNEGEVKMSRIDDAVRRILKMKMELGLFEKPNTHYNDYPKFGCKEFEKASYDAACEVITLLKNENQLLPLTKGKNILICGPNANSMRTLNGGWSYSWQGDKAPEFTEKYNTIFEALQLKNKGGKVTYMPGVSYKMDGKYWEEYEDRFAETVAAAKESDYVVLCLGENSYTEKPGDLQDLYISDLQTEMAKAIAKAGKPVVLVLNEGRPRIISKFESQMNAVVQTYLPGNFGGDALADILFGEVNPSGKLPYTYPRYPNSLTNYWHKYSEEQKKAGGVYNYEADYHPQYEFGEGLSYTTFEYSNLRLSSSVYTVNQPVNITVTVKNSGKVAGKESVLLYVSDLVASLAPDMKRLRAFDKIALQPGESKEVTFTIQPKELSFIGLDNQPKLEPGEFEVSVGGLKQKFTLK